MGNNSSGYSYNDHKTLLTKLEQCRNQQAIIYRIENNQQQSKDRDKNSQNDQMATFAGNKQASIVPPSLDNLITKYVNQQMHKHMQILFQQLPKPVLLWSVKQCKVWLKVIGLQSRFASKFQQLCIDGSSICMLDASDFVQQIGVKSQLSLAIFMAWVNQGFKVYQRLRGQRFIKSEQLSEEIYNYMYNWQTNISRIQRIREIGLMVKFKINELQDKDNIKNQHMKVHQAKGIFNSINKLKQGQAKYQATTQRQKEQTQRLALTSSYPKIEYKQESQLRQGLGLSQRSSTQPKLQEVLYSSKLQIAYKQSNLYVGVSQLPFYVLKEMDLVFRDNNIYNKDGEQRYVEQDGGVEWGWGFDDHGDICYTSYLHKTRRRYLQLKQQISCPISQPLPPNPYSSQIPNSNQHPCKHKLTKQYNKQIIITKVDCENKGHAEYWLNVIHLDMHSTQDNCCGDLETRRISWKDLIGGRHYGDGIIHDVCGQQQAHNKIDIPKRYRNKYRHPKSQVEAPTNAYILIKQPTVIPYNKNPKQDLKKNIDSIPKHNWKTLLKQSIIKDNSWECCVANNYRYNQYCNKLVEVEASQNFDFVIGDYVFEPYLCDQAILSLKVKHRENMYRTNLKLDPNCRYSANSHPSPSPTQAHPHRYIEHSKLESTHNYPIFILKQVQCDDYQHSHSQYLYSCHQLHPYLDQLQNLSSKRLVVGYPPQNVSLCRWMRTQRDKEDAKILAMIVYARAEDKYYLCADLYATVRLVNQKNRLIANSQKQIEVCTDLQLEDKSSINVMRKRKGIRHQYMQQYFQEQQAHSSYDPCSNPIRYNYQTTRQQLYDQCNTCNTYSYLNNISGTNISKHKRKSKFLVNNLNKIWYKLPVLALSKQSQKSRYGCLGGCYGNSMWKQHARDIQHIINNSIKQSRDHDALGQMPVSTLISNGTVIRINNTQLQLHIIKTVSNYITHDYPTADVAERDRSQQWIGCSQSNKQRQYRGTNVEQEAKMQQKSQDCISYYHIDSPNPQKNLISNTPITNRFHPQTTLSASPLGQSSSVCVICCQRQNNCIFLNCKHNVCCLFCGKLLDRCPLCRQPIADYLRLYTS